MWAKEQNIPMISNDTIKTITRYARYLHGNQVRKNTGLNYFDNHSLIVAVNVYNEAKRQGDLWNEDHRKVLYIIGVFHDSFEDVEGFTAEDLTKYLAQFNDLSVIKIETIVRAVHLLTRKSKEDSILDYLKKINNYSWARMVKIEDLKHNMSDLGPGNLKDKYELSLHYLEN